MKTPATPIGSRGPLGAGGPLLLLTLAFLTVGLLGVRAFQAERARERSVRGALEGYAETVAFPMAWEGYLASITLLGAPIDSITGVPPGEDRLDRLAAVVGPLDRCGSAGFPGPLAFRAPVDADELAFIDEWGETTDRPVVDVRVPGEPANPPNVAAEAAETARLILADARVRTERTGEAASTGLRLGTTVADPVWAWGILWESSGRALYGYRTCLTLASGEPTFRQAMRVRPFLPPALVGDAPPDSLYAAEVVGPDGRIFWASPATYPGGYGTERSLWPPLENYTFRLTLAPHLAGALVPGGLPEGGWLGVAILFGVSGLLLVGAWVQFRRERIWMAQREGFVGAVSHELRTPLQQILMYGDLIAVGGYEDEAERDRALAVIRRETRRLIQLVENVLSFRPGREGPAGGRDYERVDLGALVDEVVDELRPLADARRVSLVSDGGADAGAVAIRVRPEGVRRILLNLLDNAVKYGPVGGEVRVSLEPGRGEWVLSVADEGPGVPPAERGRVFEEYVRLDRSVEAAAGGSGIGLAIVRRLAEEAGGTVEVATAESGGALFRVRLPVAEGPS